MKFFYCYNLIVYYILVGPVLLSIQVPQAVTSSIVELSSETEPTHHSQEYIIYCTLYIIYWILYIIYWILYIIYWIQIQWGVNFLSQHSTSIFSIRLFLDNDHGTIILQAFPSKYLIEHECVKDYKWCVTLLIVVQTNTHKDLKSYQF
jgi:hypothetical protein